MITLRLLKITTFLVLASPALATDPKLNWPKEMAGKNELVIDCTRISDEMVKPITEQLKSATSLTKLKLTGNTRGHEWYRYLVDALNKNSTLTSLTIAEDLLLLLGMECLTNLVENNIFLRELELSNFESRFIMPLEETNDHFLGAVIGNSTMISLTLSNMPCTQNGAESYADIIRKNSSLTTLKLRNCELEDTAIIKIANAIPENDKLTSISLADNMISLDGVRALADATRKNTTLTALYLCPNRSIDRLPILIISSRQNLRVTAFFDNMEQADRFPVLIAEQPKASDKWFIECLAQINAQLNLNLEYAPHVRDGQLIAVNDSNSPIQELILCCTELPNEVIALVVKTRVLVEKSRL